MADQKISDMTAAVTAADADLVPIVQGGVNKKATVDQILDGLTGARVATALGAATAGTVYAGPATGAAAAPTFRALTVTDMVALRTFVRPTIAATNLGGGFYSSALFRITLGTTDAVAATVVAAVKITEATDSGAIYYEAPLILQRDPANGMTGSLPAGLVRTAYVGSPGTSVSFTQGQFSVVAPNGDLALLIQIAGFTAPTVVASAVLHCPGDAVITLN